MTLSKTARAALGAAALTAGLTAAAGPGFAVAAVTKVQDVFITNTEAAPVPTKAIGTTKVDATGQTITISGTADVSGSKVDASGSKVDASGSKVDATGSTITIQGDPNAKAVPVEVTNQPAAAATEQPLQVVKFVAMAFDKRTAIEYFTVPAGEEWTIERVGYGAGSGREARRLRIGDTTGGFVEVPIAGDGSAIDHLTKLYLTGSVQIELTIDQAPGLSQALAITLTGTKRTVAP